MKKLPCIFPSVNLPGKSAENIYSIYFSKGAVIEAQALATHLKKTIQNKKNNFLIQVNKKENIASQISTNILSDILTRRGVELHHTYTFNKKHDQTSASFWHNVLVQDKPYDLVLWLESPDIKEFAKHLYLANNLQNIYLSSEYVDADTFYKLPVKPDKIQLIHRYALPSVSKRHLLRLTIWARIKKIISKHTRVMANAYYAVSITANAIKHMRNNLSGEYLIEKIEHMVDSAAFHSVYPHLSLGPNQRYASKGCYILPVSGFEYIDGKAASEKWIIP